MTEPITLLLARVWGNNMYMYMYNGGTWYAHAILIYPPGNWLSLYLVLSYPLDLYLCLLEI